MAEAPCINSITWPHSRRRSGLPPLQQGSAVEGARSERLRLPPQLHPQPTHPVGQNTTWHREVCGDIGVTPAVHNPVLQQPAVVRAQIPEEGAKVVTSYGLHWADLGHVTGVSVVHLIDGDRVAAPGVSGTSLPARPLPAPEVP